MTIDEANAKAKILSEINLKIWNASNTVERDNLRSNFRSQYKEIVSNGFKIVRSKVFSPTLGYRIPNFKIRQDNTQQMINIVDNRDPNGYHKGDCTTRCISFCTGVDYMTIQKEQFTNAKKYGGSWRTPRIWSKSLESRGFCKLNMPRHMTVKTFLKMLQNYPTSGIIAALSAHHIAAIDMDNKKILDTWNSAGCRMLSIFVPTSKKKDWEETIEYVLAS